MTQAAPNTIRIPPPEPPVVTRMVAQAPLANEGMIELLTWVIGSANPVVPHMRIVRMLIEEDGVEVYSLDQAGVEGARHRVPNALIRIVEESMPAAMLAEELAAAEAGDDDDDLDGPESNNMDNGETAQTEPPAAPFTPPS